MALELEYWPAARQKGYSAWRLAHEGNEPRSFPRVSELIRIFSNVVPDKDGLQVPRRGRTFRILLMRPGVPKRLREAYLAALERHHTG